MRPHTIDEMAADYLKLIRKIQPAGPYNLLGWSFGGLVAHAIATQLQSTGDEVALLALLDSYPVEQEAALVGFDDDSENLSTPGRHQSDQRLARRPAPRRTLDAEGASLRSHHGHLQEQHPAGEDICAATLPTVTCRCSLPSKTKPSHRSRPGGLMLRGEIKIHRIDCAHDNMMDPGPAAKIGGILTERLDKQKPQTTKSRRRK